VNVCTEGFGNKNKRLELNFTVLHSEWVCLYTSLSNYYSSVDYVVSIEWEWRSDGSEIERN
jgi:hypothetical protein